MCLFFFLQIVLIFFLLFFFLLLLPNNVMIREPIKVFFFCFLFCFSTPLCSSCLLSSFFFLFQFF